MKKLSRKLIGSDGDQKSRRAVFNRNFSHFLMKLSFDERYDCLFLDKMSSASWGF